MICSPRKGNFNVLASNALYTISFFYFLTFYQKMLKGNPNCKNKQTRAEKNNKTQRKRRTKSKGKSKKGKNSKNTIKQTLNPAL